MGCSSSSTNDKLLKFPPSINGIKIYPIENQRQNYFSNQEKYSSILLNNEINKYINESFQKVRLYTFIDNTYEKFYKEFEKQKMSKTDLRDCILLKVLENLCEDAFDYKPINFQNLIIEIFENTEIENFTVSKEDIINNFSLTSRRYFPQIQKYMFLKLIENTSEENEISKINNGQGLMKFAFENIKFNPKFPINLMTIELDEKMFSHDINIINIAESINIRDTLNGICLYFNSHGNNNFEIKSLSKYIFEAIISNKNISALSIVGNEYNPCYFFNEEIKKSFLNCLKNDQLFAFCISKIKFDDNDIKTLINTLLLLKNLKFVIFDFENMSNELFYWIVNNYLKKNKKILSCLISGGSLEIQNENIENDIKKSNDNFKYFAYAKYFNIFAD